jgi:hypothetical protein
MADEPPRFRLPPAAGWGAPDDGNRPPDQFAQLLEWIRAMLPPGLEDRIAEALHDLLVSLRGVIDVFIERLERRRPPSEPPE